MQRLSLVLIFSLLLLVTALSASAKEFSNRVVAVVNGEVITLFELNQRVRPFLERFKGRDLSDSEKAAVMQLKKKMLQQMIDDILLEQEIESVDVEISEAEIENNIRELRQKLNAEGKSLEDFMNLEGYDMNELKEQVRKEILKHKLIGFWVRRKVVVTEQEIEEYYKEHQSDYLQEKRISVRMIIIPQTMSATELRRRIQNGELSFAEAADIYSQGPGAGDGGYIGFLNWKDLAPEWKEALKGLKPDEISEPFVTQGMEALLKVVELEEGDIEPLEEVRDEIKKTFLERKFTERLDEYLTGLRNKAVIEIKI